MESSSIQLLYGFVRDKNPGGELHFDLHQNFKKELLFEKQPYVAHLENRAINDVVKDGKVDSLALHQFFFATDLLQDSIQENLDMIVTDGGFNNASIRQALNAKFPNPTEVMFKDKSKFDVQNPVVGSLITQVVDNKKKEKEILRALDQAPSIRDLDIEKRFRELNNFNEGRNNDDGDDDNNNTGQSPGGNLPPLQYPSSSSRRDKSSLPPTAPISPAAPLNAMQRFLLCLQEVAEAIGQELTAARLQKITLSDKIKKIFPNSPRIIDTIEEEPSSSFSEDFADKTDVQSTIKELNNGELPFELKFFSGDEKDKNLLIETAKQHVGVLNDSKEVFFKSSKYGSRVLQRNKMKIHIESGQIFIDNQITGESLYDFLRAQQDLTKKILKVNVAITNDFDYYVKEVLANITDDRYNMNSNSTSKFLFYHFNTFRQAQGKSFLEIRHSVIADDDYALENLQNKNWQYFSSDQLTKFEESEKDILEKTFL